MHKKTKTVDKMLGVKDIQELFGIGRNKALALLNTEGFPTIRLGRTYLVNPSQLEEWIKKNQGKEIKLLSKRKEA